MRTRLKHEGTVRYFKDAQFHRDDGPTVIWRDGSEYWYQNGYLHRDGGPAVIFSRGDRMWYRNGQCDRTAIYYPHCVQQVDGKMVIVYSIYKLVTQERL